MIILASASPRRKEILEKAGIKFTVIPAENEINPSKALPYNQYAVESAYNKGINVLEKAGKEDIVVAADTVVVIDGLIIGKPKSEAEAFEILRRLSGRSHIVCTGFAIFGKGRVLKDFEETTVTFRDLSDEEIRDYIATDEPMDKAGAYGIQGRACVFVEGINGDYYNIVGLPVCKVYSCIESLLC